MNNYQKGIKALVDGLADVRRLALKPPPKLSLSEWANTYAYLSRETSSEPGKFKSFKYQNGMMDAITDPKVTTVTVMKSARIGYTRILDHVLGFFIHQDPSPVLLVQPRVEDAEDYSRTEIAPMLRDTPVLAEITGDIKSRDSDQRILKRTFKNGASITFVGANSPGGFRRITARIVAFDEVDGYPLGAGSEGDQISLGKKRSETFWNRKIILGSTPTIKGASRIEQSYEESDQREYYVPCPHCQQRQTIKWSNIKWGRDADGNPDLNNVYLVCEANQCVIEEHHKHWMIENGEWIAAQPSKGHAGFKIWAGYSLFPNASWSNLVKEWYIVHRDPMLRRTFVNLVLGETWEDDAEKVDPNSLMARAEDWGDKAPLPVKVVTAGIDVQDDRFEIEVVGWAPGEESWSLDHRIIYGDPSSPSIWKELDDYLAAPITRADGALIPLRVACMDTGGHHTQAVYAYCKTRPKVRAIKGREEGPVWNPRATRNNKGRVNLWMVGTHAAKDSIYARLKISTPGAGYCHFPTNRDQMYFDQITSEVVKVKYKNGFKKRFYELPNGKRNEALDIRVYAFAGLLALNVRWGDLAAADAAKPPPKVEVVKSSEPVPPPIEVEEAEEPTLRKRIREGSRGGGWLNNGKVRRGGWI